MKFKIIRRCESVMIGGKAAQQHFKRNFVFHPISTRSNLAAIFASKEAQPTLGQR